jgi:HAD superfamily hydrolase (TIGR01549 family)
MNPIRAVICDVYRTILDVLPPPPDAAARWDELAGRVPGLVEPPSLEDVSARCREIVARDHAIAHERGIRFPEVVWPTVMLRALPPLGSLAAAAREDFLFEHMQLLRKLAPAKAVAEFLRACREHGWPLGIASNAQHYTLRELDEALASVDLSSSIFDPDLVVWSYQNGFSKPDPHVFQILSARLASRGIRPPEILMIGDRHDNDIEPARAFGWQTAMIGSGGTSWPELTKRLFGQP